MWRILQAEKPGDYVLATNETHTVREFVVEAFRVLGEEIEWKGSGANEEGFLRSSGRKVVAIDPRYYRPTEVELLLGDYSKAERELGWKPTTKFPELVRIMVEADFKKIKGRNGNG
jgi:GDPmannose 4,6-dehydratase